MPKLMTEREQRLAKTCLDAAIKIEEVLLEFRVKMQAYRKEGYSITMVEYAANSMLPILAGFAVTKKIGCASEWTQADQDNLTAYAEAVYSLMVKHGYAAPLPEGEELDFST